MKKKINISAVILAAGLSERMGKPKFLLRLNGQTFVEMLVEEYNNFGCQEIIVVINYRDKSHVEGLNILKDNVKLVINEHPERGRFYSLQLGLSNINKNSVAFVSNVDNPFADNFLLEKMKFALMADNYVVPVFNGQNGHPILLDGSIIKDILCVQTSDLNLKLFLKKFACINVTSINDRILININNPETYKNLVESH